MSSAHCKPGAADGRLRWRCRRGVRELDVLLSSFLLDQYRGLDAGEKADFERLLDVQDPVIMGWLFGREQVPDDRMERLLDKIRHSRGKAVSGQ